MRLIFLGPPGAGKGTQAALLAKPLGIPHISTGELLRQAKAEKTPLGLKAQEYMDKGELVPDALLLGMVRERLSQPDAQLGWILDGFPRNIYQVGALDGLLLGMNQRGYDGVISLQVPDDALLPRLKKRAIEAVPPRLDDAKPEVIRNRLEVYHEKTAPLIQFYSDRQQLLPVNGYQSVETVTAALKALIDDLKKTSNLD